MDKKQHSIRIANLLQRLYNKSENNIRERTMLEKSDFITATERVEGRAKRTPIFTSERINSLSGSALYFKAESMQKVGAFKYRGAVNAVFSLDEEEAKRGVACHSSGNHAQALALAAYKRGIPAYIVMPEDAPKVKVAAVRDYGGRISFCPPGLENREAALQKVIEETGAQSIHPSEDLRIIAGQGTCLLEFVEQKPELEAVLVPVGGGGLASGCSAAAALFHPDLKVYGVEPKQADDAYKSLKSGVLQRPDHPDTIADGLRTALGPNTFTILSEYLEDIVTVSEESIRQAAKLIWNRMKLVVEPSSAVPLAGLLEGTLPMLKGKQIGIILSGGNVDLDLAEKQ